MKKTFLLWLALAAFAIARAQAPAEAPATEYTPEQLDELVAPIALYPDALIALILPASTAPTDVVLAARFVAANGNAYPVDDQPWDDSVKALVNYPQVLSWMSDNLDWTTALGTAFLQQPAQVMESIQQLRAQARANGTLVDTPQQQVELDGSTILIVPTSPDVIYVPQYDCDVVFADPPIIYASPVIVFGPPCRVGPWLRYQCDWDDFGVWYGTWHPGWAYVREWRQPQAAATGRLWRPDPVHQRQLLHRVNRPVAEPPRPRPMPGAPTVAQRPPQGFHPAVNRPPSRPDPTGWRRDSDGNLAVRPAPAEGPRVISSTPPVPARPAPARPERPIVGTPPRPAPNPPLSLPARPPVVNRPPPQPENRPPPPTSATPPTGPLFGGYTRGTNANDYSRRGQASLATAPRPAPAPRPPQTSRPGPPTVARPSPFPASAPPGGANNRH